MDGRVVKSFMKPVSVYSLHGLNVFDRTLYHSIIVVSLRSELQTKMRACNLVQTEALNKLKNRRIKNDVHDQH